MGSILNLVFDEIGDIVVPNGKKYFPNSHFWDIEDFIRYFINSYSINDDNRIKIKRYSLTEINDRVNENFYYFVCNGNINLNDLIESIFNKSIIQNLKKYKNFHIIFFSHHECDTKNGFIELNYFLNKNKINSNQIIIINNNSKLKDYVTELNSNIKIHNTSYLPIVVSSGLFLNNNDYKYNNSIKEKFFMCFNRGPKIHRLSLLVFMKKNNLLDDSNWSYIPITSYSLEYEKLLNYDEYINEIEYFNNLKLKISDTEINDLEFNENNEIKIINSKYLNVLSPPEISNNYKNSYINIVTESQFLSEFNVIHITEKSFKPFFYYQFPIIVATHHHIKTLREKYDFDFFDDLIDHSYDNEINDSKRFKMICKEVKRLHENKNSIINFYYKNYERLNNNKNKVIKIKDKLSEEFQFFKNLI